MVIHSAKVPSHPKTEFVAIGAFGNVKIGWLKKNPNEKYAIKTMKKSDII